MTNPIRPSTSQAILEAAFDILVENPGASLSDIAKRAGVGRATLHRYYTSRDELLSALTKAAIEEMDAAAEKACIDTPSCTEALRRTLYALVPLGDRYRFMVDQKFDALPDIAREFERQRQQTEELVEGAKKEGQFDAAVPTSWIVRAYDYLLYAAWESVKAQEVTPRQASDLAWKTLANGIGGVSS